MVLEMYYLFSLAELSTKTRCVQGHVVSGLVNNENKLNFRVFPMKYPKIQHFQYKKYENRDYKLNKIKIWKYMLICHSFPIPGGQDGKG